MQTVVANTRSDTLYTKNGIPVLFYKIETPSFSSNCSQQAVEKINAFYEALAKEKEAYCRTELYSQASEDAQYIRDNEPAFQRYEYLMNYHITLNRGCVVSLYREEYSYLGGAHGMTVRTSESWDFTDGKKITLKELLGGSGYEDTVKQWIKKQIAENLKTPNSIYFEDYKKNVETSFRSDNFYLTPDHIIVFFQQYDIAPYVAGITEFRLPRDIN